MANGLMLLMANPINRASSTYNPVTQGAVLAVDSGVVGLTAPTSNTDLDADGYWYDSTSFAGYVGWTSMPAYSVRRKYEVWGKTKNASLTSFRGIQVIFNRLDANNLWVAQIAWNGTQYYVELSQATAGVFTQRAVAVFTTAVAVPAIWHLTVYEQGDSVVVQGIAYESDATGDDEAISCSYTVASRANKTETRGYIAALSTINDEWLVRGCRVSDML